MVNSESAIVSSTWVSICSAVKNLYAMQELQVWSLGQEETLEKEPANLIQYSCLEIVWAKEPGGLQSMGLQKSWTRLSD